MKWIRVGNRNDMPFDKEFLAVWKGRVCLAAYNEEENMFWISWNPADGVLMRVCTDRENKFTHWMPLPEDPVYPDEYVNYKTPAEQIEFEKSIS